MVYNKQIKRGQKNNYRTKNKPVCIYIIYHSNQSLLTVCNDRTVCSLRYWWSELTPP